MEYQQTMKAEYGFTIIEMLFAVAIFLVVLAAISATFVSQDKAYDAQEQYSEMVQNARAAMDMLSTEIRQAGFNPQDITSFVGIPYSSTQLQLYADLTNDAGDAKPDGDTSEPAENIIYTYDSANLRINRNDVNTEDAAKPFAENITAFSVTYLQGDGVTEVTDTADNDKIRQVRIQITARTDKPDPDYGENDGYRTYTLTSTITPTNLGL